MDNPYRPPETPAFGREADLEPGPVPASVTVFGVLNLVYGGLGLLCNPANGLLNAVAKPPQQGAGNPILEIAAQPAFRMGIVVFSVISTIACGVLVVSGVGLLTRKSWGRTIAVGYAVVDLLAGVGNLIFNVVFLALPLIQIARQAPNPQASGNAIGGAVGGVGVVILWLIYPVLLLAFLTRPSVVAALRPRDGSRPPE